VPGDELDRAKSYIALGFPRTFETTADIAGHVAELESYGLGDTWFDDYVRRIRDVTAEDVLRVARAYVDPARVAIVIAGDRTQIEAPLRALNVGPVHVRAVEE
jgi:zinc protease